MPILQTPHLNPTTLQPFNPRRLASELGTSSFYAWLHHTRKMCRLRVVLQRVLGRYVSIAFYGWA